MVVHYSEFNKYLIVTEKIKAFQSKSIFISDLSSGDIAFRFLKYIDNLPGASASQLNAQLQYDFDIPDGVTKGVYGVNETESEKPSEEKTSDVLESHVTVCDINPSMLEVGRKRAAAKNITSGSIPIPHIVCNLF